MKERFLRHKAVFFKSTLLFYPFLLSLAYSDNLSAGFSGIQHMLPLFLLPALIFFLLRCLTKKQLDQLLLVYLCGCVIHMIYLQVSFFELGLFKNVQKVTFSRLPYREAVMNLEYESLHPTYVSLWYCFAICLALKKLLSGEAIYIKMVWMVCIALFLATIVLLSSRIAMLCVVFIFLYYLFSIKKRGPKILMLVAFTFVLALSVKKISFISSRFIEEFKHTELVAPIGKNHNSVNIRIGIYQCAIQIIEQNIWFGTGIGDVQDELNSCYSQFATDAYKLDNYNSHSYFLHSWLVAGIIGFLAFCYMIWYFFRIAIDSNSSLYICFLVIIFMGMLFENILSRNHGVLFFSIFNTLFLQFYKLNSTDAYRGNSIIS